MRLNQVKLVIAAASIVLSGCSARHASAPASRTSVMDAFSSNNSYDSDPPPPNRSPSRIAVQPSPVPPALEASTIRGISFTRVSGCEAPRDTCAAEGCNTNNCAPRRGCLSSLYDTCAPYFHSPDWRTLRPKCSPEDCVSEPECCERRVRGRQLCPCPEPACVPESRCGESYCAPPCVEEGCVNEGCQQCQETRGGLLSCLFGSIRFNHSFFYCHTGDYCAPQRPQCTTEGCYDPYSACRNCERDSPLAEPLADPFEGDSFPPVKDHQEPAAPTRVEPLVPAVPQPIPADSDIEEAPVPPGPPTELVPMPLSTLAPVPGTHGFVEPEVWPRLRVPSSAVAGRPAVTPAYPTSYGR